MQPRDRRRRPGRHARRADAGGRRACGRSSSTRPRAPAARSTAASRRSSARSSRDALRLRGRRAPTRCTGPSTRCAGRSTTGPTASCGTCEDDRLDVLHGPASARAACPSTQLIVATGATDRVLPFPGWTLPGVYTLGGAQVALKFQGCAIGQRVVFMGTGPLLYLVAWQYAKAGAQVAAVLDTARFADQVRRAAGHGCAAGRAAQGPRTTWPGCARMACALHGGVRPLRVPRARERVDGVAWHDGGAEHTLECDAVGFGYALALRDAAGRPAGCRFAYDAAAPRVPARARCRRAQQRARRLPGRRRRRHPGRRCRRAGPASAPRWRCCEDRGVPVDAARAQRARAQAARASRTFARGLERAFPFPPDWAAHAPDELVVCRCEEVTAGELRASRARDRRATR